MHGQRNRSAPLALAVALCIPISGCMLGPDYNRPPVDAPAAFRFEPKAVAETANTEWWKQFGDPVLDQLIATALAYNVFDNGRLTAIGVLVTFVLLVVGGSCRMSATLQGVLPCRICLRQVS